MKKSKFAEFLINALLPSIEAMGSTKLVEVLQSLHDGEPETYKACVKAGHEFVTPLKKMVSKTSTKIDDGLVDALDEAITMSAAANGIDFDLGDDPISSEEI